jgi:hypothetical protein
MNFRLLLGLSKKSHLSNFSNMNTDAIKHRLLSIIALLSINKVGYSNLGLQRI